MSRVCKVRPTMATCKMCMDTWEALSGSVSQMPNCSLCSHNTDEYEILQVGTNFWSGNYAMVLKDGKIEKVSLHRVHSVREV